MPERRVSCRYCMGAKVAFYLVHGALFAGFLFHRSAEPVFLGYSLKYLFLLFVLATPLAIPTLLGYAVRRFGEGTVAFALAPSAVLLCLVYAIAHLYYDYSREYPFDPFLQKPSPPLQEQYPAAKGERTFRVLALGGSTTRGFKLPASDAYPAVLERVLRERTGNANIEVLNAGQDWYTTKHSLINYVTYAQAWDADLVIVMHAINDISRSFSPPEFTIGEYNDQYSNYYAQASNAAHGTPFEAHLERRYLRWLTYAWFSSLRIRDYDFPLAFYRSIEPFRGHLEKLIDYARADGADVMLVSESFIYRESMAAEELVLLYREVMSEKTGATTRRNASTGSLARALTAFNSVTRSVAEQRGAIFVDAANMVPKDLAHHMDGVHHTALGARVLANAIADAVIEQGVIARRASPH